MPFIILFSRLPLPLLYLLSDVLFFTVYRLVRYRRSLVRENLRRSFPTKSDREIASIGKEFYRRLCDHGVEMIKLLTISEKELKKRVLLPNLNRVESEYFTKNQSLFYFSSHQFNWEWLLAAISLLSAKDIHFVYQPQQNRFSDQLFLRIRTRFQNHAITRQQVAKKVIGNRNKVRAICIVADQFPGYGHDKKCWIDFLNQPTAFFQTLSLLPMKLGYPVLFTKINRIKRGYYACQFIKVASPPYHQLNDTAIMSRYASEVEKMIMNDIPGWLWSHNRWKQKPPQEK